MFSPFGFCSVGGPLFVPQRLSLPLHPSCLLGYCCFIERANHTHIYPYQRRKRSPGLAQINRASLVTNSHIFLC